jgi:hypothetical protein
MIHIIHPMSKRFYIEWSKMLNISSTDHTQRDFNRIEPMLTEQKKNVAGSRSYQFNAVISLLRPGAFETWGTWISSPVVGFLRV